LGNDMRKHRLLAVGVVLSAAVATGLSLAAPALPQRASRVRRDPPDAAGPLDLRLVGIEQVKRDIKLRVHTQGKFSLHKLNRRPDSSTPTARFLCLRLHRRSSSTIRQLCFGAQSHGQEELGDAKLHRDGSIKSFRRLSARITRPGPRSLVARIRADAAGLSPHIYFWRYLSHWRGRACAARSPSEKRHARASAKAARAAGRDRCSDEAPDRGEARFRLRAVQPVGCTDNGPSPRFQGSRHRKRVALTFDDGPSAYTPRILKVLRRKHAKGTFFEIGAQVPGLASTSRSVIDSGSELGNHSLHHESYPGRASMAETNRRIKSATGFEPCLFRPPDGAWNPRVVADARRIGMATIIWDVDPGDWSRPGSDAIYSRVVSHARPGSIVVMHDGGGDRGETVAALPRIITTLRRRGYRFVTVTKLLHGHTLWGEVR
jgi:peptidoglycan/xylan/chitin deacetylase (PgdA/CDA1 family)